MLIFIKQGCSERIDHVLSFAIRDHSWCHCRAFSWISLIPGDQKAIESILYAHIITPLPEEVCVEGVGYVLHGSKLHFGASKGFRV